MVLYYQLQRQKKRSVFPYSDTNSPWGKSVGCFTNYQQIFYPFKNKSKNPYTHSNCLYQRCDVVIGKATIFDTSLGFFCKDSSPRFFPGVIANYIILIVLFFTPFGSPTSIEVEREERWGKKRVTNPISWSVSEFRYLRSISPTLWRRTIMRRQSFFGTSRGRSVSPTKLRPTSPLCSTRKYAQLLCPTP